MIDFSGERSFARFWLPLILLGGLVILLFPKFGPRQERTAREAWDGMVVLVSFAEPPTESLRLVATMPLRRSGGGDAGGDAVGGAGGSDGGISEQWVIGEARIEAGTVSTPLLLATPSGSDLSRRLSRRVKRDRTRMYSAQTTLLLLRAEDVGAQRGSLIGTILRSGFSDGNFEIIDAAGRNPIPAPLLELPRTVTLEPSRDRRWVGNPKSFQRDWDHFKDVDPGGLTPFIHDRLTLPMIPPPTGSSPAG